MYLKKTQIYAIRLLRALRDNDGVATKRDLADEVGISEGMVQQVMIPLRGAGLVTSNRGHAAPGYRLTRPSRTITVGLVVAAMSERTADDELAGKVWRIVMHRLYRLPIDRL